jgi:hypothetical protein
MLAERAVDALVEALPEGSARRLAAGEWGVRIEDEWPIDIGIRIADDLLRIQAFASPPEHAPPDATVLHWNRHTRIVRFGKSTAGDIWVHADYPVELVDQARLDQLLGLVVEAVRSVRR